MLINELFKIRNLKVKFNPSNNKVDLDIPNLNIPRGKLTFILGNSGSGKTTLIETLGLMSNYFNKDAQITFYPNSDSEGIDYSIIWKNEDKLSEIRKNYFSFMFQNENLFPQFNVLENVMLTPIIQNSEKTKAKNDAMNQLSFLQIGDKFENSITELSGGERQRVSFARTTLEKGFILFADEPTGNLGKEDAFLILNYIYSYVNNPCSNNTALVVTHNINTALEYADNIIIITQNEEKNIVLEENIINEKELKTSKDSLSNKDRRNELTKLIDERLKLSSEKNKKNIEPNFVHTYKKSNKSKNYDDKEFIHFYSKKSTKDI
ncbi:ATP-binding cassette domain-containing protein, partial [candidate division KSB1 bacterium]